jgi:cytochrome c-type biogenesis protein CcmH/NrfF
MEVMTTTLRRVARLRRASALHAAVAFASWPVVPAHAQSTGPAHAGFDPTAPLGGHYHEGLTGEQSLIIERNIKCLCSCNLDTHSCQFQMRCDTSPGNSQRIMRELQAGQTRDEIEAGFVADYGGQVLMAPPAEGFNLLGYFLPAAAILAAGTLIAVVVRGNTRRAGVVPITEIPDEDAERLRAEWQKLDRSERPDW